MSDKAFRGKEKSADSGVFSTCRAAFDPELASQNGAYLNDCQVANDKLAAHSSDSVRIRWTL